MTDHDPWLSERATTVHVSPHLNLGAKQVEIETRSHPTIAGLVYLDWHAGSATLSVNGTVEQLADLLARSLHALNAYEQAKEVVPSD